MFDLSESSASQSPHRPRPSLSPRLPLLDQLLPLATFPEEVPQYYPELTPSQAPPRKREERPAAVTASEGEGERSVKHTHREPHQPVGAFEEGVEAVDYLGRSFLQPPPALISLVETHAIPSCRPPGQLKGNYKGGHTAGVQLVQCAPESYGHLLFSADMGGTVKLWDSNRRSLLSTYSAHREPIRSGGQTPDATLFSTGSSDGTVTLWDVEQAKCTQTLTNTEGLAVGQHLHHPSDPYSLLLVSLGRKFVLYDVRASVDKYQREYTGHMGTIFNLTLLSGGSKLLSTAEDRTLRTWDFRIPIQIMQFADVNMHAISHVAHHPTQPFLAAQSLDNRITVFKDEGAGKLRSLHQRSFTGHTISGTRCQLAFSHDGKYVSSGDISGQLFIWEWESGKLVKTFKAHKDMLTSHVWHPCERSRVVTASWDTTIKQWS